ncbi:hypothetical protein SELMODRAFT_444450 [Selaginella moellendorffii]|uniref:VWFA domain-containing protein n=1 Tax=Selaginella moellendorffii TaxID=88036 RepID=D8SAN7_SELML|nr:uncharacterized protein LOC9647861 [Selaginella moellendorffii]EFJ18457.1 hypothetical protein SELMODRAFT_444450 [Selaginella moellendorffii]|eukprot:XP_002980197.1 uncharacterized protein LOC9647861 [Selaginella moellendorffii]
MAAGFENSEVSSTLQEDEIVHLSEELGWLVIGEQPELKIIGEVDKIKARGEEEEEEERCYTALVHLKAPKSDSSDDARAPVDLVTVLDVSGSMRGQKLELVKTAMEFVIRNLRQQDRLAIVSFSDEPKVHLGLKRMTYDGREAALSAVEKLRTLGGTEIRPGLKAGFDLLSRRRNRNPVSSIMLLSDGMDNAITFKRCKVLPVDSYLEDCSERVPVHTFGFGSDHDPEAMLSIAEATGGSFCYVQEESTVQHAFAQCIGGLLSVVAQEVEVCIEASGGAKIRSVEATAGTTAMDGDRAATVKLGSLYAEEERDILVELLLPSSDSSSSSMELLKVGGSFRDPGQSNKTQQFATSSLVIQELKAGEEEEAVRIEVDRQKNRVSASKAMAAARKLGSGSLASAKQALVDVKEKIESSRAFGAGDGLSKRLVRELDELIQCMKEDYYQFGGHAMLLAKGNSHCNQRASYQPTYQPTSRFAGCSSNNVPLCGSTNHSSSNVAFANFSKFDFHARSSLAQDDEPETSYETSAMVDMLDKSKKFKSNR